jgi:hypothetical protein
VDAAADGELLRPGLIVADPVDLELRQRQDHLERELGRLIFATTMTPVSRVSTRATARWKCRDPWPRWAQKPSTFSLCAVAETSS